VSAIALLPRSKEKNHAVTQAHQIPQAAQGPHSRSGQGGYFAQFRRFGLKALEPERLNAREIEAARRAITRHMKRAGRVWIRIFPDVPVSKKPAEVRMGSGKGAPEFWVAKVKPGRILFEIDGVDIETAREAMRLGQAKLSIATKFVARMV
jgi:large subunit ribosomal protein L16